MTSLAALADCITSGQVPQEAVPALCKDNPGLGWILERRSRATPARTVQTGQGAIHLPSHMALCPVDPFNLNREAALSRGSCDEESRRPLKHRGLLSQFIRSLHSISFLPRKIWRQ